ncbi:GDP/GTP exchange factor for ARF [Dispira parvispora]|uniref:GDP/GTP exchange factor for ARF n=1 Tax=Dispira parvispora TaxID=1520584 RepID=A0A9W8AYF1_9FUNG|nr:GDP/GTP exchange factor for ARF [Dispira parvispora]
MPINTTVVTHEVYRMLDLLSRQSQWKHVTVEHSFGKLGVQLGMSSFGPAAEATQSPVNRIDPKEPDTSTPLPVDLAHFPILGLVEGEGGPSGTLAPLWAAYASLCDTTSMNGHPPHLHQVLQCSTVVSFDTPAGQSALLTAFYTLQEFLHQDPDSLCAYPIAVVFPFVAVVRAHTTAPLCLAALECLQRLVHGSGLRPVPLTNDSWQRITTTRGSRLSWSTLPPTSLPAVVIYQATLGMLGSAAAQCRFVSQDTTIDELVLVQILELMDAVYTSDGGFLLTDDNVCEMLETIVSLSCQMRLRPGLRTLAESILSRWIRTLFSPSVLSSMDANSFSQVATSSEGALDRTVRPRRVSLHDSVTALGIQMSPQTSSLPLPGEPPLYDTGKTSAFSLDLVRYLTESVHGPASAQELVRVLVILLNPHDLQYTDSIRRVSLRTLQLALETAGSTLEHHTNFYELVTEDLLKHLFQILEGNSLGLLPDALRLTVDVWVSYRRVAPGHFQSFVLLLLGRLFLPPLQVDQGPPTMFPVHHDLVDVLFPEPSMAQLFTDSPEVIPYFPYHLTDYHATPSLLKRLRPLPTPQHRALFIRHLDGLLDLQRNPTLMAELWLQYDTTVGAPNLWELVLAFTCRHALPLLGADLLAAANRQRTSGPTVSSTDTKSPSGDQGSHASPSASSSSFASPSTYLSVTSDRPGKFSHFPFELPIEAAPLPLVQAFQTPTGIDQWQSVFHEENILALERLLLMLRGMLRRGQCDYPGTPDDDWHSLLDTIADGKHPIMGANGDTPLSLASLVPVLKCRSKKERLWYAVSLFNRDPKVGVHFLLAMDLIPPSSPAGAEEAVEEGKNSVTPAQLDSPQVQALVRFLRSAPGLDKVLLGDFLSRPKHLSILQAYIQSFDFYGLRLDEALRLLLTQFRIPGESQQIERVVETFSHRYYETQTHGQEGESSAGEVASADAAFVLAYAVIMLNTDQHSPQVKTRMKLADFCRNLRGVNNQADFSPEYLEAVFNAIRDQEIVIAEEHDRPDYFDEIWRGWHRSPAGREPMSESPQFNLVDALLFRLMYRSLLMNFSQVLLRCTDDKVLQLAMTGLFLCSELATLYQVPSCLEDLVGHLCTMSGILEEVVQRDLANPQVVQVKTPGDAISEGENKMDHSESATNISTHLVALTDLSLQLGRDYRGQIALILLAGLVRTAPGTVHSNWPLVWQIVQSLVSADLVDSGVLDQLSSLGPSTESGSSVSPMDTLGGIPDHLSQNSNDPLPEELQLEQLPLTASSLEPLGYFPDPTVQLAFQDGDYSAGYRRYRSHQTSSSTISVTPNDTSIFSTLSSIFLPLYNDAGTTSHPDGVQSAEPASIAPATDQLLRKQRVSQLQRFPLGGSGKGHMVRGASNEAITLRWDAPVDLLVHLTKSAKTAVGACKWGDLFRKLGAETGEAHLVEILSTLIPYLPHVASATEPSSGTPRWVYQRGQAFLYEQWLRLVRQRLSRVTSPALSQKLLAPLEHTLHFARQFPIFMVQRTLDVMWDVITRPDTLPDIAQAVFDRLSRLVRALHESSDPRHSLLHHPSMSISLVNGLCALWQTVTNDEDFPHEISRRFIDPPDNSGQFPLLEMILTQAVRCPESRIAAWQLVHAWLNRCLTQGYPIRTGLGVAQIAVRFIPDNTAHPNSSSTTVSHINSETGNPADSLEDPMSLQVTTQVLELLGRFFSITPSLAKQEGWDALTTWTRVDRPLLTMLLWPCINPQRSIRQLAITRFQQALTLTHPSGRGITSDGDQPTVSRETVWTVWSEVFDNLLFPVLKHFLRPAVMMEFDAQSYEETCFRLVSLVSSFFLRHLHGPVLTLLDVVNPEQDGEKVTATERDDSLSPFSRVWLTWLELWVACLNRMDEWGLGKEVIIENLKNMLRILSSLGAFDRHSASEVGTNDHSSSGVQRMERNALWQATWQKLGWALPDLQQELFPNPVPASSAEGTPLTNEDTNVRTDSGQLGVSPEENNAPEMVDVVAKSPLPTAESPSPAKPSPTKAMPLNIIISTPKVVTDPPSSSQ